VFKHVHGYDRRHDAGGPKLQVLEWSDDGGRADVVAAIDAATCGAGELPTVGYVGRGQPGRLALKYAHRAPAGGGERSRS
jgi:hypothetical protein